MRIEYSRLLTASAISPGRRVRLTRRVAGPSRACWYPCHRRKYGMATRMPQSAARSRVTQHLRTQSTAFYATAVATPDEPKMMPLFSLATLYRVSYSDAHAREYSYFAVRCYEAQADIQKRARLSTSMQRQGRQCACNFAAHHDASMSGKTTVARL